MLLHVMLLLLVGVPRVSRADYKWTGSEWVYLEGNRDTIETIEHSGQYDVSMFYSYVYSIYLYKSLI